MTGTVEARLRELNLELPNASAPIANYVPHLITGNQLYVSGQVPLGPDGLAFQGKVGVEFDVNEGQQAARLCALNILGPGARCLRRPGPDRAVPQAWRLRQRGARFHRSPAGGERRVGLDGGRSGRPWPAYQICRRRQRLAAGSGGRGRRPVRDFLSHPAGEWNPAPTFVGLDRKTAIHHL